MLKKLQFKFMAITMFALSALLFVQIFAVNVVSIYQRDSELRSILEIIAENNGRLPNSYIEGPPNYLDTLLNPFGKFELNMETPYSTRYFVVEMHKNVATKIYTDNISSVNDAMAFQYASQVYAGPPGFGFLDNYRYYYLILGEKAMIIFLDFQKEVDSVFTLASISFFVSLITMALILIPVYWLSKLAMRSVSHSINKQKQFITDASHELKTPLAIIAADVDILEMCEGENEWLSSIKNQTVRMNGLVKNLVRLSKLDEMGKKEKRVHFSISDAVLETASDFETSAKSASKDFVLNIDEGISYRGDEAEIRQLVSILCDNAVKYTDEGGSIRLTLTKSGKSIILEVHNTCEYVDPTKVPRLFDRFYRADASRSRDTGGYGIGLSIAKAIVDRNKGKIRATVDGTTAITFRVVL